MVDPRYPKNPGFWNSVHDTLFVDAPNALGFGQQRGPVASQPQRQQPQIRYEYPPQQGKTMRVPNNYNPAPELPYYWNQQQQQTTQRAVPMAAPAPVQQQQGAPALPLDRAKAMIPAEVMAWLGDKAKEELNTGMKSAGSYKVQNILAGEVVYAVQEAQDALRATWPSLSSQSGLESTALMQPAHIAYFNQAYNKNSNGRQVLLPTNAPMTVQAVISSVVKQHLSDVHTSVSLVGNRDGIIQDQEMTNGIANLPNVKKQRLGR